MHIVINLFLGIVAAWAVKRRNGEDGLGWWRFGIGAIAGILPHMDDLLYLVGPGIGLWHQHGITWSFITAPVMALVLAKVFEYASGGGKHPESPRKWGAFFLPAMASLVLVNLCSALTPNSIMPLAPLTSWRLSFYLLNDFDLQLFFIGLLTVAAGVTLRYWQRDIARIGLIIAFIYIGFTVTLRFKALDVAETYAQALGLQVIDQSVLPQPISPFHWRIIIETEDRRLHDTRVHLTLEEERVINNKSPRASRVAATYKPIDKAVWRIYHRFGRANRSFAQAAWESEANSIFRWHARYAVLRQVVKHNGVDCAEFKDLRFDGARRRHLGGYLLCPQNDGHWTIYQAAEDGRLLRLELMN